MCLYNQLICAISRLWTDPNNRQLLVYCLWAAAIFNAAWCLTYSRHSSLHIAFRESIGYTARDGNGRERLDIVRDGTGTVFNLLATRGNGTGMDLPQRDGTGLVMIFIPVSLYSWHPILRSFKTAMVFSNTHSIVIIVLSLTILPQFAIKCCQCSNQQRVGHFGAKSRRNWLTNVSKILMQSERDTVYTRNHVNILRRLSTMHERDRQTHKSQKSLFSSRQKCWTYRDMTVNTANMCLKTAIWFFQCANPDRYQHKQWQNVSWSPSPDWLEGTSNRQENDIEHSSSINQLLTQQCYESHSSKTQLRITAKPTCCQYAATSGKFRHSHRYTRFRTSFWKQLPPKPA